MKLKSVLNEGFGRQSSIYSDFFRDITNLPNVEKLIQDHALPDGHAFLLRGKDGNAYEIQIRPAEYAEFFPEVRKESQYKERKQKESEQRKREFGM